MVFYLTVILTTSAILSLGTGYVITRYIDKLFEDT